MTRSLDSWNPETKTRGKHLARSLKVRGKEEVSWEFRFMVKAEGKREKAWVPTREEEFKNMWV